MKIPDFTALGTNNPRSVGPISPSDSGSMALADSVKNLGNTVGQIGDEAYKRQANLALATADSQTIKGLLDLKDKIQSTDDYNNWQKDFDAQAPQVTSQVRSNLLGPETQSIYDVSSIDHISRMSGQIDGEATKRREDVQRGGLAQLLQDNREVYMRSNDPDTRANLLASTNEAITAASAPAPGRGPLIDPATAVSMKKGFVEGLAKDYVQSLPPDQAINVLGASVPGRLRGDAQGNPTDIWGAIHAQESGGAPTSATSVDGAIGGAQILPKTFAQYAKPGEKISNPADNLAVGQRIVADYSQKYGGDPARVAVAYFSGPGNVAPAGSPTPYIKDFKDGNGKSVLSYVQDVTSRIAPSVASDIAPAKTGTPVDFLPLADRIQLYHGAVADARTQRILAAQADTISNQKTQNDFLTLMQQGKLTSADVINSDLKPFGTGSKDEFLRMLNTNGGSAGPDDSATFQSLFDRIHLPDGDPNKITDPNMLNAYFGHGIGTIPTLDRLRSEITMRNTPDGQIESDLKKGVYDAAKAALVKGSPISGFSDPNDFVGREQLQKYSAWFDRAYKDGRVNGKSMYDLLDPSSKDYLGGKNIEQFRISDEARMHMQIDKIRASQAPSAQPSAPSVKAPVKILSRVPGETPEQYLKRVGLGQ